ncbi:hypothetical protein AAIB41_13085 [Brucella sp. BE17]|uniref:DUF6916 family protein n=1 Tax=Brucella sp. BE17 TaxID=3142977 RepID=UPI0031BBA9FD
MMLSRLTAENFAPFIGMTIALTGDDDPVEAVLKEIVHHPKTAAPNAVRGAFSLILSVRQDSFSEVTGGHYIIVCDGLGPIGPVYIERVLSFETGIICLEIVFN